MGAGLGIGSQMLGNAMQIGQNDKLLRQQIEAQKEMGQFNNKMAYEMWLKTNYDAQRKQMEKAGLNVGLMYGSSGAGGGTAQSNSGNVSGQQASSESGLKEGAGMGLMLGMNQAQIENIKADTEKKLAEKKEVEQRTPTYAKGMQKTDAEINKMATEMGVNVETVRKIIQEVEESKSRIDLQGAQKENIETLTPVQKSNIEADTNKKNEESKKIIQETKAEITRNVYLDRMQKGLLDNLLQDVENKKNQIKQSMNETEIKAFTEEMKADYPSLFQVGGKALDGLVRGISRILSGQDDRLQRKIEVKRE